MQDIPKMLLLAAFNLDLLHDQHLVGALHPVWLSCESSEYPDIPVFSRLARRAPQRLVSLFFCRGWLYFFDFRQAIIVNGSTA